MDNLPECHRKTERLALPEGWMIADFGGIFTFENKSKHTASEGKEKGKFKFFTSSNFQSKFVDSFDLDGEFLIFGTGGNASIHHPNEKFSTSTDCLIAKTNNTSILTKYVYYYLAANMYLLDAGFRGAGLKHISKSYIQEIKIPYPKNKEIQNKIVAILEKAEETKRLRAQADELTDRLLQSVFIEIFGNPMKNPKGWEKVRLNDVCEKIQDGTHFSPQDQTGEVPYVTAKNIRPWGIDLTDVTYVTREFHEEIYRRCDPKKGDVIYIKDGVTAGLAKVNSLDFEFSMLSSIAMIRPKRFFLNSYYLEYYLNYPATYKRIMERKSGSAITRLILREIKDINIHLPPLPLQQEFARIVEKVESMRQSQKQSKQQIEDLFSTLMQKAFRGELDKSIYL